jgi:hypothetical protein
VTLSDPRAGRFGVTLSAPDPDGVPAALGEAVARVEDGTLTVREPTVAPLDEAAEVHAGLGAGALRGKIVLAVRDGFVRRTWCV